MKECDKQNSHTSSKIIRSTVSSNNGRHPVTKTFTPLHPTTLHYAWRHFTSSHLNFTQLHFTTLSLSLNPCKFPTAPFHLTSLHFTSLHFTPLHFYMIFTTILFLSFHRQINTWMNKTIGNTPYLCILNDFHRKWRLFPYTTLTARYLSWTRTGMHAQIWKRQKLDACRWGEISGCCDVMLSTPVSLNLCETAAR